MLLDHRWRRWRARWARAVPALCEACGRWPDGPLCPTCQRDLAPLMPRCPRCALPRPAEVPFCASCLGREAPPWTQVLARVDYAPPWDAWVAALKFRGRLGLAAPLARLWLDDPALDALLRGCDVWLPIPLAPRRLAERGYNQVWALMQALAAWRPTPCAWPTALQRRDDAPAQHRLDRAQRLAQAPQLFALDAHAAHRIRGCHVLVVDDVMTTGATLQAASAVLLAAGARAVSALVLARTPRPGSPASME
ncbi:ComF family protein [Tepidimonas charontis]|uniref:ComF: comF family protein n=1 Tax=Tepidimonas charontis TaxID=2267262 RepID=A0A554X9G8_9BURK|nr:ComF family protein [Tepidimonas charontis]TSE32463.1 comF: comF family protein [Tepidimonas charontis]